MPTGRKTPTQTQTPGGLTVSADVVLPSWGYCLYILNCPFKLLGKVSYTFTFLYRCASFGIANQIEAAEHMAFGKVRQNTGGWCVFKINIWLWLWFVIRTFLIYIFVVKMGYIQTNRSNNVFTYELQKYMTGYAFKDPIGFTFRLVILVCLLLISDIV